MTTILVAASLALPGSAPQSVFNVNKSQLRPSGSNAYFSLRPGDVWVLADEELTVTITVLDETRRVDGVTTRIVEEHEVEDGELVEISHNFYAIDRSNGNAYYFGEDVDDYEDGEIVSHEGAWRSGVNGARFGLFMPAEPRVGQAYMQENAPGVATDTARVISLRETVVTPLGIFRNCLLLEETNPLDGDTSHKWFAPGVGLVQDDEAKLIARYRRP
jgi:hypothetical protein